MAGEIATLRLKYKGSESLLSVPAGECLHTLIAKKFGIPSARLKLLYQGKQYTKEMSEELFRAATENEKNPILVMGTVGSDQLDSRQQQFREQKQWLVSLPQKLWSLLYFCFQIAFHFFTSLFSSPKIRSQVDGGNGDNRAHLE